MCLPIEKYLVPCSYFEGFSLFIDAYFKLAMSMYGSSTNVSECIFLRMLGLSYCYHGECIIFLAPHYDIAYCHLVK